MRNVLTACFTLMMISLHAQQSYPDTLKVQMLKDWERAKSYTLKYLEAMPAENYAWKPTADVRNFAQQWLHVSWLMIGFVSNGTGQQRELLGADLTKPLEETIAHDKETVKRYVLAAYDFAIEGIRNAKAVDLFAMGKSGILKLNWINKAFEHQTHHRGQCTLYFRLKNIVPPHEELF